MKTKTKTLLALITAFSFSAQAAVVTQEDSFGTQGSTTDVGQLSPLSQMLTINPFDSSLGELVGVTLRVFGQINSMGSSTNNSSEAGRTEAAIFLAEDWMVSSSAADDGIFASANNVDALISAQSSPAGTFTMIPGDASDTFEYDITTGELSFELMNVDLSAFLGDNPIEFLFTTDARTTLFNQVEAGTGNFSNDFSTGAWGRIVAEFNYTTDIVSVAAPATLGLVGLSLFGSILISRRKS
jgi:hypothetical protein